MTVRDDGLAARRLQDDEFGANAILWRGDSAKRRTAPAFAVAAQPNGDKSPRHKNALESKRSAQSSSAFTDLGDSRRLRRLRFTLLRWLTRLGPRAMATPIANTSITTRWAMREVSGV